MWRVRLFGTLARHAEQLAPETRAFALLRGLTVIGGVAALFMVPLRPEHQAHFVPFLGGVIAYKAVLLAVLVRWAGRAWKILLATLGVDLGLVFLLVWFTGGGDSHFFLLFYLLVALNAHYFGPGIGVAAAVAATGLLAAANALTPAPAAWIHVGSRAVLLGLLGLALGHVAAQERAARARAETLAREVEAATARLVEAERLAAVGRLSSRMAHEVRNPLGAINLNVDLLGDLVGTCPGPAMGEAQELLGGIREEVRGLAALTDEYLVAARPPRPAFEEDSLNDLVRELVEFIWPLAERQGVTVALDLDPSLPLLAFDRAMLRQALRNLLKNSLEALPHDGRVVVATRREDGAAVVTVADAGPGIAPAAVSRLFEPFFTTKPRGTGLGLSIARQIARDHGGELTWSSEPGRGASFSIRLPIKGAADA
ncbi:MAG: hypothetical protein HY002_11055 [Candidatus Rokubacteria bacterium]|nr:hypothetical protein [Candidatus Rokubacteria bacterium]